MSSLCAEANVITLEDDDFLPEGVLSPYKYYISRQNHERHSQCSLACNFLEIPQYWEFSLNDMTGSIYYMGQERATVYFSKWESEGRTVKGVNYFAEGDATVARATLPEQKTVRRVEWHLEDGWSREQCDYSIKEWNCKSIFNSRREFAEYFLSEATANKKIALFIQGDKMLESLKINLDMEQAWDFTWLSDNGLLDKYKKSGRKNRIRFYAIPESYPIKEIEVEALILTGYDQIEKIEDLIRKLLEVIFHIVAHIVISSKLTNLGIFGNVRFYPGVRQSTLDELWEECSFYLDINLYGEICDAVNVAQQKNCWYWDLRILFIIWSCGWRSMFIRRRNTER